MCESTMKLQSSPRTNGMIDLQATPKAEENTDE